VRCYTTIFFIYPFYDVGVLAFPAWADLVDYRNMDFTFYLREDLLLSGVTPLLLLEVLYLPAPYLMPGGSVTMLPALLYPAGESDGKSAFCLWEAHVRICLLLPALPRCARRATLRREEERRAYAAGCKTDAAKQPASAGWRAAGGAAAYCGGATCCYRPLQQGHSSYFRRLFCLACQTLLYANAILLSICAWRRRTDGAPTFFRQRA